MRRIIDSTPKQKPNSRILHNVEHKFDKDDRKRMGFDKMLGSEFIDQRIEDFLPLPRLAKFLHKNIFNPLRLIAMGDSFETIYGVELLDVSQLTIRELSQYNNSSLIWDDYRMYSTYSLRELFF